MRIAILSVAPSPLCTEIVASLRNAQVEVVDFLWDAAAQPPATAAVFLVLGTTEETENTVETQSLVRFINEQNSKGRPIIGLGYRGVKLLVDNGLVPGIYKNLPALRLQTLVTEKTAFEENAWIRLAEDYQYNAFTQKLAPHQRLPVKRCTRATFDLSPGLQAEMQAQGQLVFFYCDAQGQILPGNALAGISNKNGNVLALLPYPELPAGTGLLQSLQSYLETGYRENAEPLCYWPRK